jgi:hypothetical protein
MQGIGHLIKLVGVVTIALASATAPAATIDECFPVDADPGHTCFGCTWSDSEGDCFYAECDGDPESAVVCCDSSDGWNCACGGNWEGGC